MGYRSAYRATKYIGDCLDSLQGAEILVGVDHCQDTLDYLKNRTDVRLFYFTENVGPYVIKNTLIDEASHEHVLFFDSDDILNKDTLHRINEELVGIDYLKLNYINFSHEIDPNGQTMNDAVIAIKRSVFNNLNGFQPWRCAADTELAIRLNHNDLKFKVLSGVAYYRRLHDENLTIREETGHGSPMRSGYVGYIINQFRQNAWPNPHTKIKQGYVAY